MALPSSGDITLAMVNVELGRSASAALSLNDPEVRQLAGRPSGQISLSDLRGKSREIVVNLTSSSDDRLDKLFTAGVWASDVPKRVIIPSGVEIGSTSRNYAIATGLTSGGQAGSFGGQLTLENHGVISGRGGAANSGAGGDAIYSNVPGRNGQKLRIENYGTIRSGGGGGGVGGKGGTGGGGRVTTLVKEPTSGYKYQRNVDHVAYVKGTPNCGSFSGWTRPTRTKSS
ncbi:hypothetical protein JF546_19140 [Nitratireductor aquimarinus]|uniref:hypothetical protein n=1 Tax=Nitratireductor aquimarinus TaxID=889300 RepID=UPI001A8E0BE8|nr:hypothetical protein [Nitratireductor aquimarinus]MBN8245138.1 hypothetical protein [Nitratireductor aquimarinus]MBY6133523.1 hypothetical protein [Nitratireductor aquimarinus]MCA1304826.1 hypothetical protein [Nitratireductor aquimarinus]